MRRGILGCGKTLAFVLALCLAVPAGSVAAAPADIGEQAAVQAAIRHSGLPSERVQVVKVEKELENGYQEYSVECLLGSYLFEYKIDGRNGKVKGISFEMPAALKKPVNIGELTDGSIMQPEKAVQLALHYAGVDAEKVSKLETEGSYDDGILKYEVEFSVKGVEYSYEINALDGSILSYDIDLDDDDDDDDD